MRYVQGQTYREDLKLGTVIFQGHTYVFNMQAFRSPHNCLVSIAIHEPGSRLPEADPYTLSFISSYSNLIAARPGNRSNRTMGCLAAYMFKLTFQKQHLGFLQIKNVNRVEGMSGLISLGLNFSGSYLKR